METEIIVAILSLIGTALGTYGGIRTANKLTNHRIVICQHFFGHIFTEQFI